MLNGAHFLLYSKNPQADQAVLQDVLLKTTITLPSGGEIGLYQPSHRTAVDRG